MTARLNRWDYLIVTASNPEQAVAYESRLQLRRDLGLLRGVTDVLVVPDPGGARVGSGGSTLFCLMQVLTRELCGDPDTADSNAWLDVLSSLRILILHAGGDSRRLPAYGPCGKSFIPVPGESDSALPLTLFDRQLDCYMSLPEAPHGAGQTVITSGDVLLRFDPNQVRFASDGVTGLACYSTPEQAGRHGVFCRTQGDQVRLFLQKPSIEQQRDSGAIDAYDQSCLDIGVMSFDAATAVRMLKVFGATVDKDGKFDLSGAMGDAVINCGLDFYREICCAMGTEATPEHHRDSALSSGSKWSGELLGELFDACESVPFSVKLLKYCDFMEFGTSRALIHNGTRLLQEDRGAFSLQRFVDINNDIDGDGSITGTSSWVEGCRIDAPLTLGGDNLVVGVDIEQPLTIPPKTCLDVIEGIGTNEEPIWFVRCYGIEDTFKVPVKDGPTFCGVDFAVWQRAAGAKPPDIWDKDVPDADRTLWNARLFPAVTEPGQYRQWLWMLNPRHAKRRDFQAWRKAERYSLEQILATADYDAFERRRRRIRRKLIWQSLRHVFRLDNELSSSELAYMLGESDNLSKRVAEILAVAHWHSQNAGEETDCFVLPRIMHTLGSALEELLAAGHAKLSDALGDLRQTLTADELEWLDSAGLGLDRDVPAVQWARCLQRCAFEGLEQAIIGSRAGDVQVARSVLRTDEIVWARAPARLDLGGGWTDTPPYSLERGGRVVNAAINLNGQPPVQAYLRAIEEPVIRLASIDLGVRIEITNFDELLDYRLATGSFALAEAALVLSGISPTSPGESLRSKLKEFGGGIELTTLAAIPKGSGLGTSSIMGAVIVAAIQRAMGRQLSRRDLFHSVLRLEQALTTGGGWQDQIGGVVDGVKMITTEPGLIPDARMHYLPDEALNPWANAGVSLLYYTGVTRLAKNILQQVVGRYLNRNRSKLDTLRQIGASALDVADALTCKDIARFGSLLDAAWELNKQLDPNSTNSQIDTLFARVAPHIHGGKLLGAGGGGFMLMICKSPEDAASVVTMLNDNPPNERARFFDFDISDDGLTVTVC